MRRRRDIPADPVKSTSETVAALGELLQGTLPSVDPAQIVTATNALESFAFYLVPGEHLAREPASPTGAAKETEWELFLPVPVGAPFEVADLEAADPHFRAGPAPENAGTVAAREAVSLADLVDPQALRAAGGE